MTRTRHEDDGSGADATAAPAPVLDPRPADGEREADAALRPRTFDEYVGQREHIENLRVFVRAAQMRREALDHILVVGPPGLGKTTIAHVIAHELGVQIHVTSGPAVDNKAQLAGMLTTLGKGDVLFIDEIHRLSPVVEESLYAAMEDFRVDIFIGAGPNARSVTVPLPPFTLLAATTRVGLLSAPLRDRFGYTASFRYYPVAELASIVRRSARLLEVDLLDDGGQEIARRARGTPRVANRLLRRVRDFADVKGDGRITRDLASFALGRLEVDAAGLDEMDRGYLRVIVERFDGGPVGIEAIAASLGQERDTLEDWVEPFLVQEGYVARTPRGRQLTGKAYLHLGLEAPRSEPKGGQPRLL